MDDKVLFEESDEAVHFYDLLREMDSLNFRETKDAHGTILLSSMGLNTKSGSILIRDKMRDLQINIPDSSIYIISPPEYGFIESRIRENCSDILGFKNIYFSSHGIKPENPGVIYCGECQETSRMLDYIKKEGLGNYIKEFLEKGSLYIGASAGGSILGKDILIANKIEGVTVTGMSSNVEGLGILDDSAFIPHYTETIEDFLKEHYRYLLEAYNNIYKCKDDEVIVITDF